MNNSISREIAAIPEENANADVLFSSDAGDFANQGISPKQIPDYVMNGVTNGKIIGTQGRSPGRPIYSFEYNGEIRKVAVTIADNGFIVGANPR